MRLLLIPVLLAASGALSEARGAGNDLCLLFTKSEASAYLCAPVGAGQSSLIPGMPGCTWSDDGTGAKLSLSVSPAGNALQLKTWGFESWEGFRSVPDIGARAYVARSPMMEVMGKKIGGDWQAGAIVGSDYVAVGLKGPKGDAGAAIGLLKEVLRRRR